MKRKVIIAGNWKLNQTQSETEAFFSELRPALKNTYADLRIFVPFTSLSKAVEASKGTGIEIGAQNAHWEQSGAYTGEVSGPMLKEIGIQHVLIGHSERRQFFGETDETVKRRASSLLSQDFEVMVCIGETLKQREAGEMEKVLGCQLNALFNGEQAISPSELNPKMTLAYEPVWAIGTGLSATPEQAEEAHSFIRSILKNIFGDSASSISLLYGGSVKPGNIKALLACPNIDGALVGGASLKAGSFNDLIP